MIANKDYVINKLNELTVYAKKNFGQNFLINDDICQRIVGALDIKENETIIEIGPGLGALSYYLSLFPNNVQLYDVDEDMVNHLNKIFKKNENVQVINQDFLKVDLDSIEGNIKVIGNLPYYITTPLIEKVLLSKAKIKKAVFMIQKEVLPCLVAKVNQKEYGPLSILIEGVGNISKVMDVSRNNFYPVPHVDSTVFQIEFKEDINKEETIKLYKLISQLFLMRRKTILNNLTSIVKDKTKAQEILNICHIDELKRPENLSLKNYIDIANALAKN
ncbi:MAG: 16S rRNA (adenine(1518)-N(6)/adenine(1519)-N(6))-dimethyltransferase RsmA [Bacilli bacterium]